MEFSFKHHSKDKLQIAELSGRIMDKSQCADLLHLLEEGIANGQNLIILEMSKVDYMNSSGLNVLVNILTKARNKNGEVVIASLADKVKQLFLITKLNTLFSITDSVEEAEKLLNEKYQ